MSFYVNLFHTVLNIPVTSCVWAARGSLLFAVAVIVIPIIFMAALYVYAAEPSDGECHDLYEMGLEPAKAAWIVELCTHSEFLMFAMLLIVITDLHVTSGFALIVFACLVVALRMKFGVNLRTVLSLDQLVFDTNKKTKTG